jgi:hypothetical protein
VAQALVPGTRVDGFEQVAFKVPLKLHGDRDVQAWVSARALAPIGDGKTRVQCVLGSRFTAPSGQAQGPVRLHFEGTVVLSRDLTINQPIRPNGDPMKGGDYDREKIYDLFFHGRSFQVLTAAEDYDSGMRAAVDGERLQAPAIEPASAPMELEALFQTAGLWQIMDNGSMGLPSLAETVRIYGKPSRDKQVECYTERRDDGRYEALLRDESGRVYVELQGYEMVTVPPKADKVESDNDA